VNYVINEKSRAHTKGFLKFMTATAMNEIVKGKFIF
jgi:hypothetical protein